MGVSAHESADWGEQMARRPARAVKRKALAKRKSKRKAWPAMGGVRLAERRPGQPWSKELHMERVYEVASKCGMTENRAAGFALYFAGILKQGRRPEMSEVIEHYKGRIAKKKIEKFYDSISY